MTVPEFAVLVPIVLRVSMSGDVFLSREETEIKHETGSVRLCCGFLNCGTV
jgi:hypothetical protein